MSRRASRLYSVALLCMIGASVCLVPVASSEQSEASSNVNKTRLQARVSLVSRSFDLDGTKRSSLLETDNDLPSETVSRGFVAEPETNGKSVGEINAETRKGGEGKGKKSTRRLSNIWSMFLPGSSSAESDYEDGDESADETSVAKPIVDSAQSASAESSLNETGVRAAGSVTHARHDERPLPFGTESSARPPLTSTEASSPSPPPSTTPASTGEGQPRTTARAGSPPSSGATNTSADSEPVKLITGALSRTSGTAPQQAANVNEMVSSIMSSMSAPNSTVGGLEREFDLEEESKAARNNELDRDNGNQSDNFDRWLNRIKLRQQPMDKTGGSAAPIFGPTLDERRPLRANAAWHLRTQPNQGQNHSRHQQSRWPISAQSLEDTGQQQQPVKGSHPKRAVPHSTELKWKTNLNHHHQSHPFQQQMRQQSAQLIHGIRMPAAQASTISVSNSDLSPSGGGGSAGAVMLSNTSLSFGSHYIPQLNPSINGNPAGETSPIVVDPAASGDDSAAQQNNGQQSNHKNGNDTNSQGAHFEQSVYQSQDEILRQVTSAIHFEQQQLQQQQQQQRRSKPDGSETTAPTVTRQGEETPPDGDDHSKSLKLAATGNSELAGPAESKQTTPSTPIQQELDNLLRQMALNANRANGSATSAPLGAADIDKSFDLLAEKVRLLASQQREQQQLAGPRNSTGAAAGGQSPSWLRPAAGQQAQLLGANLSSLLAASSASEQQQQQQAGATQSRAQLEHIRELISGHERAKSELKSSQESMMQLLRQMAKLKQASGAGERAPGVGRQAQPADSAKSGAGQQGPGQPAGVTNVGWFPVGGPPSEQQHRPPPVQRVAMSAASNSLKEGPFANEKDARQQQLVDEADGHGDSNNQMVGLPIALLEEEQQPLHTPSGGFELSPGQIEEAARLVADQLSVQNSQDGGELPPLGAIQQVASPLSSMRQAMPPSTWRPTQRPSSTSRFQVPRVAPSNEQQVQASRNAQAANANQGKRAPPNEGDSRHDRQQHLSGKLPAEEQRRQQIPSAAAAGGNLFMQAGSPTGGQQQQSPQLLMQQVERLGPQHYVTSTISAAGGPPMKMREISFVRPFGFRGHHAISYQAPPAVAAMISRLKGVAPPPMLTHDDDVTSIYGQRPSQVQARPPLFANQMAPARAKLAQVVLPHHHRHQAVAPFHRPHHRLPFLSTISAGRLAPLASYPSHDAMGNTLPIAPFGSANRPHYSAFSLSPHPPPMPPIRRSHTSRHWPAASQQAALRGVRLRHVEAAAEGATDGGAGRDLVQEQEELPSQRGLHEAEQSAEGSPAADGYIEEEVRYVPVSEYLEQRRQAEAARRRASQEATMAAPSHFTQQQQARRALAELAGTHRYERIEQPSGRVLARQTGAAVSCPPASQHSSTSSAAPIPSGPSKPDEPATSSSTTPSSRTSANSTSSATSAPTN